MSNKSHLRTVIDDACEKFSDEPDSIVYAEYVWDRLWSDYLDTADFEPLRQAFLDALLGTTVSAVRAQNRRNAFRNVAKAEIAAANEAAAEAAAAEAEAEEEIPQTKEEIALVKARKASGKSTRNVPPKIKKSSRPSFKVAMRYEWWTRFTEQFIQGEGGKQHKIADCTAADLRYAIALRRNNAASQIAWAELYETLLGKLEASGATRVGDMPETVVDTMHDAVITLTNA